MELKYKGQFNHDIDIDNRRLLEEVKEIIVGIKTSKSVSQIPELKKLKKYKTHYRIKVSGNYRIGAIIRKQTIWLVCFGHRSVFYKNFPYCFSKEINVTNPNSGIYFLQIKTNDKVLNKKVLVEY